MTRPTKTAASAAAPRLRLSLQLADDRHRKIVARAAVARWIRAALAVPAAEITVRVVDEAEGLALNRRYRGQDHATNVLTFIYSSKPLEGDIVICAPVVAREARQQGKTVAAHHAHLLVHGLLHLQGMDHEHEAEARTMERRERTVLARLGFPDPYA